MRTVFFLGAVILVSLIFLIGCVTKVSKDIPKVEDNNTNEILENNINTEIAGDSSVKESIKEEIKTENTLVKSIVEETKKEEVPATTTSSTCVPGWKCISSTMKAYLNEDCTWKGKSTCKLGCANNACIVGSVCTSGFKCMNNNTKGFQNEDCSWDQTVTCDLGCKNAACAEPVNTTLVNVTI
ncbi:hypothetical protein HYX11_00380 [Candidatus Woesearchaeota archaeon]|nr:hypothetical protein [Candidatus Woesearchaeota archaeon]